MAFNARSDAHNGHGSTDKYWKLASSAMELVTNLKSDSSAAEAWAAAPAPICHTHNLSIPPRAKRHGLTNEDRDSQRKGKWTKEEEQYTNRIIELYKSGHLRLPGGLTLRSYLAEKLNCDPMRITKKFGGASSTVKEAIQQHTRLKIPSDSEIQGARNELDFLERQFRVSIEHHGQPVLLGQAADFLMSPPGPPDSQGGAGTPGIQLDPSIMSSLPLQNYHSLEDNLRDRTASFFDLAQRHGGASANIGTAFYSPPPTIMSPIASDDILNLATIQAAALLTPILAHQAMANNLQYHIQAAQVSQAVEQQLQQLIAALNPSQFQTPNGTENSNSSSVVVEDPTQVRLRGGAFPNKDQTTDNITSSQAVSALGFSPSSSPSVVSQKPTKPMVQRKRKNNKSPRSPKDQDRSKRQRASSKALLADKNQKATQIPVVSPSSVRSTREDDAEMFLSFVGSLREQTSMPQENVGTPVLHHES